MAKVIESTAMSYPQISAILNFLEDLDCSLISIDRTNNSFTIGNKITATLTDRGSQQLLDWSITYNGNTGGSSNWQWTKIKVVYSDTFIMLVTTSQGRNTTADERIIYEKIGSRSFANVWHSVGNGYNFNIKDYILIETETSGQYVHNGVLLYMQGDGYIDYTNEKLFIYDPAVTRISNISNSELLACSTLRTTDQVITFGGNNYISLGTNTLIQINT